MFKFIHAADIHLDSPLTGLEVHDDAPVEEIRGATRRAFVNLVDLAIEEGVAFILIAGDLYDGDWKDYNTGLFIVRQMGRLGKAGIKVFIVSGNHDAASRITRSLPFPANVVKFSARKPESVVLHEIGTVIHGQSYRSQAVTDNLAKEYPQAHRNAFNIGLLHTSLTGRPGHEPYAPCTLDDLRGKGYDYWALGHIHNSERPSEDPPVIFPGNIQGRNIKEVGAKGVVLVTVEDGQVAEIVDREVDVLRWALCRVDLSGCEVGESVYERVREVVGIEQSCTEGRPLAMRLELVGRCPLHMDLHARSAVWREEFRAIAAGMGGVWLEKVKFQTSWQAAEEAGEDTGSPFAGLIQAIEELDFDGDALVEMVPDLASLKTKLPPELITADSVLSGSGKELSELKETVKEFLVAELLQKGDEL